MRNDIKPEVGQRFQFVAKPMSGWCGIADREGLELDEQGFTVIHGWLAFFEQFWTQRMRKMEDVLNPGLRRGSTKKRS